MDITPFVESLRADLVRAAEVGGQDVRTAAERLSASLDAAVRLAFMEALSHASRLVTRDLSASGRRPGR